MKTNRENKKFNSKRQDIVELAKKYLDKNGNIDMTKFRKEQSSAYSRLAYYFNGVNGLLEAITPFSREENEQEEEYEVKKATGRGCPINAQSVRNELAYDMLKLLRKNHTFHEIGEIYGVSRAHVHQLEQVLQKTLISQERKVTIEKLM